MLCEQPVAGASQLARVAARISVPVMADESAWTPHDILELDQLNAAAYFSCYVTKPGGLWRARQQAEARRTPSAWSPTSAARSSWASATRRTSTSARRSRRATLPSVCPVTTVAGTPGPSVAGVYYTDDVVAEPFRFADGRLLVPDGPGLGIEVDRQKLAAYAA